MKLTCANCRQQIVLEDAKLPQGVFKVKCPKCGKIVTGQKEATDRQTSTLATAAASAADELQAAYATQHPAPAPESIDSGNGGGDCAPDVQAFVKKEVARLRKEIQGSLAA
ncbi:MAG TPA: zinc-ribbon domain-containing protein, partial [Acidobacteriota bacterium]|nr:zinc-ribbon domain-containing protein [Acidobacteriota bacterium]